jgi:hypothetical protein
MAVLAIGLIVSAVKLSDVVQHLATIIAVAVLLIALPAIMEAAWASISYWQHLGIVALGLMIGLSLRALRQARWRKGW